MKHKEFGTNNTPLSWKDILIFIIGLLSMIKVRILGTFGISELLCFGLYFCVANPFLWIKHKGVTHLFLVSFIWLVGVFISDRYNGNNINDSLKGFFNVFFLLSLIPFVYWALYDKLHRVIFFWAGNAISSLIGFYIFKSINLDEIGFDVWRVYAWHYPFIVIAGILYYKGKKFLSCIVAEGFAVWSLFHLSRNIFLTITIAICIILFIENIKENNLVERVNKFKHKSTNLLIILLIAFAGISSSYEYLASNKILGERAYTKYYMQKHSKYGIISGRGDFIESAYLVYKKPLVGYGSYARNNDKILNNYYKSNNISYNVAKLHDRMLPGHSYLMGSWVYAGILGFFFWVYVVIQIGKYLRDGLLYERQLVGLSALLTFATLWNIFFSPFADRLNFLFYIIMIILTLNSKDYYVKSSNENLDSNSFI